MTISRIRTAWVASVMMGLGHARAAHALRSIGGGEVLMDGSPGLCSPEEYRVWERLRSSYYLLSRGEEIPLVGGYFRRLLDRIQNIPPLYPQRDLSAPTAPVRYLERIIRSGNMGSSLRAALSGDRLPLVNTFYATAIAQDIAGLPERPNYCLICDSDFNRVWVPRDPASSRIIYLAPCTKVKRRLMSYGVPAERIHLTGFPLPVENIGTESSLDVLKEDLYHRLTRLDPLGRFATYHRQMVREYLGKDLPAPHHDGGFSLIFSVGGAGAQTALAGELAMGLAERIRRGQICLTLAAGISPSARARAQEAIRSAGLEEWTGRGVSVLYDDDVMRYFDRFNMLLRTADLLWTKPSELSFYCGLGIGILMAPSIGAHEELNRRWLTDIHAGLRPAGSARSAGEWLFDLRDNGFLAEAAWNGFLKARKLGVYKIARLIKGEKLTQTYHPLAR